MQLDRVRINTNEAEALEWLEGESANMIALVKAWSGINSGSYNRQGLDTMRVQIADSFSSLQSAHLSETALEKWNQIDRYGEKIEIDSAPALHIRQRPKAPIKIVLTGHYDTVFPQESPFQNCRLIKEDYLNGPGTADMKGGLIVMLYALKAFERTKNRNHVGYNVLISPDEEIGSPASAALIHGIGVQSHLGMTYEPCMEDGKLAGARKGSGNFSLIIRGRAAHAGRNPSSGRNAIEAASRFVIGIQNLNGQKNGVTINTACVDGGGALNIVPDLAIVRFNIRLKNREDQLWVMNKVQKNIKEISDIEGIKANLEGKFTRPPKPMLPPVRTLFEWTRKTGEALGIEIGWKDTGGVCEGNNLWAAGCPNVDTLGVRGGKIHSHDEYVILSSFVERAKLSALMLMKIASGEFDISSLKR